MFALGPRPWRPEAELEGALDRGDLRYAMALAEELRRERGWPIALGLAWRGNELMVSVRGSVRTYQLSNGGLTGAHIVVGGLPTGRHQNDAILPMPNGDVLLGVLAIGPRSDSRYYYLPQEVALLRQVADKLAAESA